jgi:indole-3-glycerol phosphate synthase
MSSATPTVLQQIAARKATEVAQMYATHSLQDLQQQVQPGTHRFARKLAEARARGVHAFITEFKRRSPSNPSIGLDADPATMARMYIDRGASAISVLTDAEGFGGSFADMQAVVQLAAPADVAVLNKDFVIDPIQVYLARHYGADIILLIAAILTDAQVMQLYHTAQSLGMDCIAEVHTAEETDRMVRLGLPIIGVNNRDLHSFRIHLNTVNVLADRVPADRTLVAESGMASPLDFAICGARAHAFLVGTSLMQGTALPPAMPLAHLSRKRYFFKACGLRQPEHLAIPGPDLVGINLSPQSKRRADPALFSTLPRHTVGLFYGNEAEAPHVLAQHPFPWVQLYISAQSLPPLPTKPRIIRALKDLAIFEDGSWQTDLLRSDLLILDGATPGSGQQAAYEIPADFPIPFLLAGGLHLANLEKILQHPRCIGVDVASGIEENGQVSAHAIQQIRESLDRLAG